MKRIRINANWNFVKRSSISTVFGTNVYSNGKYENAEGNENAKFRNPQHPITFLIIVVSPRFDNSNY